MSDPEQTYVRRVLDLYRTTPGTLGRVRAADRRLAAKLYEHHISVEIVQAALLMAVARRTYRPLDAEPLPPIASLHYFIPVIDELRRSPPPNDYLHHLRTRLEQLTESLATTGDHQIP